MEKHQLEATIENQILFVEFMLEHNNVEILQAIKKSLIELKELRDKEKNM